MRRLVLCATIAAVIQQGLLLPSPAANTQSRIKPPAASAADVLALSQAAQGAYGEGRFEAAAQLYTQALMSLGPKSSGDRERAILLTNLGAVNLAQKKNDEAIRFYQQSLDLKKRVFGEKHPSTLDTLDHLVEAFNRAGRQQEAASVYQQYQVLPIAEAHDAHQHINQVFNQDLKSTASGITDKLAPWGKLNPSQAQTYIRQMVEMSDQDRHAKANPQFEDEKVVDHYDERTTSFVAVDGMFNTLGGQTMKERIPVYRTVKKKIEPHMVYKEELRSMLSRHPVDEQRLHAAIEDGATVIELGNNWLVEVYDPVVKRYWQGATKVSIDRGGRYGYVVMKNEDNGQTLEARVLSTQPR